jgi:hypothetical protein
MPSRPAPRLPRLLRSLLMAALAGACSGGDDSVAPTDPSIGGPGGTTAATTGSLTLVITGLPPDVPGDVLVTGPNGLIRVATGTVTWADLPVGNYTLAARAVRASMGLLNAGGAPQQLQLTGAGATGTLAYAPVPAMVAVLVTGVPNTVAVPLRVSRPFAPDTTLGIVRALSGPAGPWRVAAATLEEGGTRFAPSPSTIDTTLRFGDTARVAMRFVPVTGALAVAISGLPAGVDGVVDVRGPDGFQESVRTTRTLSMLSPGRYRVVVRPVTVQGIAFRGAIDSTEVLVEPSVVAAPAPVAYTAQLGTLRLETTGLVAGTSVPVTLSGNGITRTLVAPGRVDSLPVGSYTLGVTPVTLDGYRYAPLSATVSATVAPAQATGVTLAYEVLPTVLDVTIEGLPASTAAKVTLAAPDGEPLTPVRSQRFLQARPGSWTLQADTVASLTARHAPSPAAGTLQLAPGDTGRFAVQYTQVTGMLAVAVTGLPAGVGGAVVVRGPDGYERAVSGTTTLTHLRPGSYTIQASGFTLAGMTYTPATTAQQVTVTTSAVAAGVSVFYSAPIGELAISASGLPPSGVPVFTVTGPVTRTLQGPGRLIELPTGAYSVTAAAVTVDEVRYEATPTVATVTVANGAATPVHFTFAGAGGGAPNLRIQNVTVTQAVQTAAGDVPLVAGRRALVRVWVTANSDSNNYLPRATVVVTDANGAVLHDKTVAWLTAGVPTFVDGSQFNATLNTVLDSAVVKPGIRIKVALDPYNVPDETNKDDNVWPRDGIPRAIPVTSPPPFQVRFVPVTVGGLTGNVSSANLEQYLSLTRLLYPISAVEATVAPPFTSSVTALDASAVGPWSQVLSELNAARTAASAPLGQHYYGVVKVTYNAGIAGVGYVPGRTALGWDDGGSGGEVAAHEWGHNFGRSHAPCGTSGDAQYPHSGGIIGHYGWIPGTGTIVSNMRPDIMGYCPAPWVSDYTWNAVLSYRQASAPSRNSTTEDGLLVWGRVSNGRVVLEPAFRVRAPLTPLPAASTHRLELLAADGAMLGAYRLPAQAVDHGPADEQHFAAVIPYSPAVEQALATIRVRDVRAPLRGAERTVRTGAAVAAAGDPATAAVLQPRGVQPRWQGSAVAMAMVRDATTGEVLGFVRDPGRTVSTNGQRVEVVFSDGVRSTARRPQ